MAEDSGLNASVMPPLAPPSDGLGPDNDSITSLINMGFSLRMAQLALRNNDTLEAAVEWLFVNNDGNGAMTGEEEEYEMIQEELKMVMVVRSDLGMSAGKVASQCVHAALGCYRLVASQNHLLIQKWEGSGEAAVCLKCKSESEMEQLEAAAAAAGLPYYAVHDAGRTQIVVGSVMYRSGKSFKNQ